MENTHALIQKSTILQREYDRHCNSGRDFSQEDPLVFGAYPRGKIGWRQKMQNYLSRRKQKQTAERMLKNLTHILDIGLSQDYERILIEQNARQFFMEAGLSESDLKPISKKHFLRKNIPFAAFTESRKEVPTMLGLLGSLTPVELREVLREFLEKYSIQSKQASQTR